MYIFSFGGDFLFSQFKKSLSDYVSLSKALVHRFFEHKISYTGGELAYFFLLSVFPFLIFTNSAIRALDIPRSAAVSFFRPFLPNEITDLIADYIEHISEYRSGGLLSFGILLAIFSASKSVRALAVAFDLAYGASDERRFIIRISSSMLYIFIFAIVFVACVVLVAFGNGGSPIYLFDFPIPLALFSFLRWITISVILFLVLLFVYKYLPARRLLFREALPGTFFSLFSFLLLAGLFSVYTKHFFSSFSLYGSLSAVILLMLWLYFAGIILVLGAELNAVVLNKK